MIGPRKPYGRIAKNIISSDGLIVRRAKNPPRVRNNPPLTPREKGIKGGAATLKKYGRKHFRNMGKKSRINAPRTT